MKGDAITVWGSILGVERILYAHFQRNSSAGYSKDVITVKNPSWQMADIFVDTTLSYSDMYN